MFLKTVSVFLCLIALGKTNIVFQQWLVKNGNGSFIDLKATVPGGIYTDLMNNKIIGDIFYEYNDVNYRWVAKENWTYYTKFTVQDDFLKNEHINIVFEGLDTYADVKINNITVGKSRNMFVKYIFDIKKTLKLGLNTLEVEFRSPLEMALKLAEIQNKNYNIPPQCTPESYHGECHVNYLRKMQASFAWDWGPAFPSMGIWKDFKIRGYNKNLVEYVVADVTESNDQWIVNVDVYFTNDTEHADGDIYYELDLEFKKIEAVLQNNVTKNEYGEIVRTFSFSVNKYDTKLWWPNGYGAQQLYNLKIHYANKNMEEYVVTKRIGFRTIELVQEKIKNGLTFYFKVNNEPIFIKGANEIPIDILPEKGLNKEKIKRLLTTAYDSHMNMLRVWGGGVYESDYFYDVADELGILIWQDFMFACALYPVDEGFLTNVVDEVRHQVKRLYGHPSIALFAGNNENEAAIAQNWYQTNGNKNQFVKDYVKLYIDTIENEYNRLTNFRGLFLSSSPTNGDQSKNEGYVAKEPGSSFYGDVHYYNYVLDSFKISTYPKPRFASEYGYQSYPSFNTMLTTTKDIKNLNLSSAFMDHIQHHPVGNIEMKTLIDYQLKLPDKNHPNYTRAFIYYSQIIQAMSIKIETEHYRSLRSDLDASGQGQTMGALYWQLNDVWVAPTWSGIDYLGKWKMLQYYTMDFFAPVIVTGSVDAARNLNIYVVSDKLSELLDVTLYLEVYNWNSTELKPVNIMEKAIDSIMPSSSMTILNFQLDKYLSSIDKCQISNSLPKNNCFIHLRLKINHSNIYPENFVIPGKIKDSNIPIPNIQISYVKTIGVKKFEIVLKTDKIALFVWLESHPIKGRFSENGFIQINSTKTIYFYSDDNVTLENFKSGLYLTNLLDTHYF
ncbi:unnamed protein product [Brassicogethes aeneus]|uniref:Beta-mannosidase B n=1 Tax=Brassicogethes aeneus TaxID=1431903 RepID=A0A9P0FF39_BRAAE|nr:unnamed protein product [Brassicogethes aeneus]